MNDRLVTVVFKPSARAGAAIDLARVREVVSTSGASKPDAVLDERTGGVHVTFASVGDAEPVIARLREELGGQWTFAGEASYGITEPAGGHDIASRRSALALGALALFLAVSLLAGFVPYDFDDSLLGYLIGATIVVAPLALAAYLVGAARRPTHQQTVVRRPVTDAALGRVRGDCRELPPGSPSR